MKQYKRSKRVGSQILRDIQKVLEQECAQNLDAMVTFTEVDVSDDLRYGTVYYTVLGDDTQKQRVADYFSRIEKRVQNQIGRMLNIKTFPELKFKFDPSVERGMRVEQLLQELAQEKNERDKTDDI